MWYTDLVSQPIFSGQFFDYNFAHGGLVYSHMTNNMTNSMTNNMTNNMTNSMTDSMTDSGYEYDELSQAWGETVYDN